LREEEQTQLVQQSIDEQVAAGEFVEFLNDEKGRRTYFTHGTANEDQDRLPVFRFRWELLDESKFVKITNGARRVEELINRERSPAISPTTLMGYLTGLFIQDRDHLAEVSYVELGVDKYLGKSK
jgi:hypothetical protein